MIELTAAVEETLNLMRQVKKLVKSGEGLTALSRMYGFNPLPPREDSVYNKFGKEQDSAGNGRYH